jgi:ubiquinone/menaquinone biosynthesis C-methylase UbiE
MFHEESYERHKQGFATGLIDLERMRFAASCDTENANWWRDSRGYEIAEHLGGVPGEKWLTIGDGRFGLDSVRLKKRGVAHAFPTNIDVSLLQAAKDDGIISEYSAENAECLSLKNKSFDYVFCKEAYHHFPRPMIALYEMLRVARKGIILVEPNDRTWSPARRLVALLKRLSGRGKHMDATNYEDDGNYVFSISRREIEKVALGINIPQVAFKEFNDLYIPGIEFEPANIRKSAMYRKMRIIISARDLLCRIGLDHSIMMMACIFHEPVTKEQRKRMIDNGWVIVDLPRNPYASI